MLYKFRSKASGDVIMLGPHGDALLALLGRPAAARGIVEVAHMPQALALLEQALAAAEPIDSTQDDALASDDRGAPAVGLRQRLWPMIDMLRRCHAAGEPITWDV